MSISNQTPELETEPAINGETETPDTPEMVAIAEALDATQGAEFSPIIEAARTLGALALEPVDLHNDLADTMADDGPASFTALLAALRALRLSLDIIEVAAHERARREMRESAQTLTAWQGAGVAPEMATA